MKNSNTRPQSSLNPTHRFHQNRPEINETEERYQNVILVGYNGAVLHHTGNGRYLSRQEVYGVISNYASFATFWKDILSPVPICKYFIHKLYTTNEVRFFTRLSHSCAHTRFIHNSIPVLNSDHHDVEICALRGSYIQILNSAACFVRWKIKGTKQCYVQVTYIIGPTDERRLNFKRRIKSRLPFAGIIRSSPYSPRFQDKG